MSSRPDCGNGEHCACFEEDKACCWCDQKIESTPATELVEEITQKVVDLITDINYNVDKYPASDIDAMIRIAGLRDQMEFLNKCKSALECKDKVEE